jgi:hypothetical protein
MDAMRLSSIPEYLVYNIQPVEDTIFGITGSKNGAIKYIGFVDFMGDICIVAHIINCSALRLQI